MNKFLTLFQSGTGGSGSVKSVNRKIGGPRKTMTAKQIRLAGTNKTKAGAARMNKLEIAAGRPANMGMGPRKTIKRK